MANVIILHWNILILSTYLL